MNAQQPIDDTIDELAARQAQARLERLLAARKAAESLRAARYSASRTRRSEFRAGVKAAGRDIRPEPEPAPRPALKTSIWRDLATFLFPVAFLATAVLLAHWAGWLK